MSLASALVSACGPTALRSEEASTISLGGTASRRVETLTDLEEVRAVVSQDGLLYVGTDGGLLRYVSSDAPGELVEGLPSDDIRGLVADDSALLVAAGDQLVRLEGDTVTPVEGVPAVGHLTDTARTTDGTLWLCGLGGVARRTTGGSWETFGEPVRCTTLAATPEGQLWVGTTAGLWYVEGDVIREHPISGGMPESYVRSIVPVLPGKIMAILQGPNDAKIAYWDGARWFAYTLRGLDGQAIGLVRRGADVLLVSQNRILALAPRGAGVPLVPIASQEGTVRSFRARTEAPATPAEAPSADVLQEPKRLAEVPQNLPSIQAPAFVARALEHELPGRAYRAFVQDADAFLAISNGGVLQLPRDGNPRLLRSRSLVPEEDLQIASDPSGTVWTLSREGHLAKFVNGRLRRVRLPAGNVAQAIASGTRGAYLVTLVTETPNTVRVFVNAGRGWAPQADRTLALPTPLLGAPFMGVALDGKAWVALRVQRDEGEGQRMRGVAVIDLDSDAVVYHHRGADREQGGLPLPDEVAAVDFDTDSAWFATLSGLVRVGSAQAVVFGEARGVRGEVVTDVVVGSDVIWLAAAEGLGSYDRSEFDFTQPEIVGEARPSRLAMDLSGRLWAASPRGLLLHDGEEWRMLNADNGLPTAELRDVEIDAAGRAWLLAEDRVMVLEP